MSSPENDPIPPFDVIQYRADLSALIARHGVDKWVNISPNVLASCLLGRLRQYRNHIINDTDRCPLDHDFTISGNTDAEPAH